MVIFCEASVQSGSRPGAFPLPRRSLCRVPALSRFLCWAPALSVSVLGALCVGFRRSPALSVSGPGALCVAPRHSLAVCVGCRRSLWRALALSRTLCVGARRPLCGALWAGPGGRLLCHPCGQAPMRCAGAAPAPLRVPPLQSCGPDPMRRAPS